MNQQQLAGVFAPVCTPFGPQDEILYPALEQNIGVMNQTALAGYFVLGTNGECKALGEEEQRRVLSCFVAQRTAGKIIMAGVGAESSVEAIRCAHNFADIGVDMISLLMPSFFARRLDDSALTRHILAVAESSPLPVVLYNNPSVTAGVAIAPGVLRQVREHPNVVGLKDSDKQSWRGSVQLARADFSVLAGSAGYFLELLEQGGSGGILSLANVFPVACARLFLLYGSADTAEQARRLNATLMALNQKVSGSYGVAGVKAAMDIVGLNGGRPRAPLPGLSAEQRRQLQADIEHSGLGRQT